MSIDYDGFVEGKWLKNDDPVKDEAHAVFGLAEEVGELAGKYVQAYVNPDIERDAEAMLSELGDIKFYLTRIAHLNGYTILDIADFPDREQLDKSGGGSYFMLASAVGNLVGKYKRKYRVGDAEVQREEIFMLLREVFRSLAILSFTIGFCPGEVVSYNVDKLNGREERGTLTGSGDDR